MLLFYLSQPFRRSSIPLITPTAKTDGLANAARNIAAEGVSEPVYMHNTQQNLIIPARESVFNPARKP